MAVAKDGSLYMLDKFGYVWRAPANAAGGYDLEKEPLAHLGSGRPLGFHFDADGNLIVCNAGSVRSNPFLSRLFPKHTSRSLTAA